MQGTPAIYTASTRPLAVLEILAHYAVLPRNYVLTEIQIPVNVKVLPKETWRARLLPNETVSPYETALPTGWDAMEPSKETQYFGTEYLLETAVLRVPSAVLYVPGTFNPFEYNYVLNPEHPDFAKIEFSTPVPFEFDPRLKPDWLEAAAARFGSSYWSPKK